MLLVFVRLTLFDLLYINLTHIGSLSFFVGEDDEDVLAIINGADHQLGRGLRLGLGVNSLFLLLIGNVGRTKKVAANMHRQDRVRQYRHKVVPLLNDIVSLYLTRTLHIH